MYELTILDNQQNQRIFQNHSSPPLNPTSPQGFGGRGRGENVIDPPDSVLPKPRAEEDKGDDRGFYRQSGNSENSFGTPYQRRADNLLRGFNYYLFWISIVSDFGFINSAKISIASYLRRALPQNSD